MPDHGTSMPGPQHGPDERRGAERFGAAMPVHVDGAPGTTEDLSTSGLSFLSDRAYDAGDRIEVVIEYLLDGHQYPLRCDAEVVRSQPTGAGYKVAARLVPRAQLAAVPRANGEDARAPAAGMRPHLRSVD